MQRRKWFRFSLRAMLGMVMLLGVHLGGWDFAKHRAVADVRSRSGGWTPDIAAPYLLCVQKSDNVDVIATYHVWCFGLVWDLPYSRQFPETGGFISGGVRPRMLFQQEPELDLAEEPRQYRRLPREELEEVGTLINADQR